jgi:hypothetical protein
MGYSNPIWAEQFEGKGSKSVLILLASAADNSTKHCDFAVHYESRM